MQGNKYLVLWSTNATIHPLKKKRKITYNIFTNFLEQYFFFRYLLKNSNCCMKISSNCYCRNKKKVIFAKYLNYIVGQINYLSEAAKLTPLFVSRHIFLIKERPLFCFCYFPKDVTQSCMTMIPKRCCAVHAYLLHYSCSEQKRAHHYPSLTASLSSCFKAASTRLDASVLHKAVLFVIVQRNNSNL